MRARPARRSLSSANQCQPPITTASVLLLMLSLHAMVHCNGIGTQASLDSAAAALHSGNLGLALPHALDAWGSGRACQGLRIALWITHGEQPSGGLVSFVSQCNGAADSGVTRDVRCSTFNPPANVFQFRLVGPRTRRHASRPPPHPPPCAHGHKNITFQRRILVVTCHRIMPCSLLFRLPSQEFSHRRRCSRCRRCGLPPQSRACRQQRLRSCVIALVTACAYVHYD